MTLAEALMTHHTTCTERRPCFAARYDIPSEGWLTIENGKGGLLKNWTISTYTSLDGRCID